MTSKTSTKRKPADQLTTSTDANKIKLTEADLAKVSAGALHNGTHIAKVTLD